MKIGIYFFVHTHTSFLKVLLGQVPEGSQIDLYSPRFFSDYRKSGVKVNAPSLLLLLWRMRSYDTVVIDEVTGRYLLWLPFFFPWRKRVYLVVHNLKSWVEPRFSYGFGGFMHSCLRSFILKLFKRFVVVGSRMKAYGEAHCRNKAFYFVPFGWGEEVDEKDLPAGGRPLSVVVPSTVSARRRYEGLLRAAQDELLRAKINVVLLGRPEDDYGRAVVAKVKELGLSNIMVFEDYIPKEQYHACLKGADFIMSDFKVGFQTRYGQTEIYGQTKETGVSFIILSYAKPGILPANFMGMEEIENQVLRFSTYEDLKILFLKAWADPGLMERLRQAGRSGRKALALKVDNIFTGERVS